MPKPLNYFFFFPDHFKKALWVGGGGGGGKLSVYKTVLIVLHDTDSMAVSPSTSRLSLIMHSQKWQGCFPSSDRAATFHWVETAWR